MIKWLKKNHKPDANVVEAEIPGVDEQQDIVDNAQKTVSIFAKFKQGLKKTKIGIGDSIANLLLGKKEINADLLEELESLLISADLGIDATSKILNDVKSELKRKHLGNSEAIFEHLRKYLKELLLTRQEHLIIDTSKKPYVILMVGINGAGKTTTIGKLAKQFKQQGKKVMLAAGDTFRAAAVEQLQAWGERNSIPVIAQHTGADSASVIYDAMQAAQARGIDILIADTAGRLHTQNNLMEELKKVKKVIEKLDDTAPHEIMLVLDASIGQNALNQAQQFHNAVAVSGITITKLDGTARGGILFAIANALDIPFRFIGIGEGIDDLRPFDANYFVDAIFEND